MGSVKYIPNRGAVRDLLYANRTQRLVRSHGDRLADSAGDGFVPSYMAGKSRYRGIVYADTWSAKHRDHRENILVRVLG